MDDLDEEQRNLKKNDQLDQNEDEENDDYNIGFIILISIVGSIGGFIFGYDIGIIGGAQLYFKNDWEDISTVERELIVSLVHLGAVPGSLVAGPFSDYFGRKPTMLLQAILFTIGAFMMAFAGTIPVLMGGRLVSGFGIGVASQISNIYLSELSPISIRGTITATYGLGIDIGLISAIGISIALNGDWRWMLGFAAIPSILQLIMLIFSPETQRWYAKNERFDEAHEVLKKIYTEEQANRELEILKKEVRRMKKYIDQTECDRYGQLCTKYRKIVFIGCMLLFWQQVIGINTVTQYGPTIIIDSGLRIEGYEPEMMGIILSLPFAFALLLGTIFILIYVDVLGRRYLILRCIPFLFLSLIMIAIAVSLCVYSDDEEQRKAGQIMVIIGITAYLLSFGIGFQAIPWIINSEIYPIHLAGTGAGLAAATHWITSFMVSSLFLTVSETNEGKVLIFVAFALCAVGLWLFVYYLLPETKGKRVNENIKAILGEDADDITVSSEQPSEERKED